MRITALLLVLVTVLPGQARDVMGESPLSERAASMVKEAIRSRESHRLLASLCRSAPRRLSGSPGAAAAVEWARQEMTALGLQNVRLDPVSAPRWVRGSLCRVRVLEPGYAGHPPLAAVALGGSVPTAEGGLAAEVVEVRHSRHLRELGREGLTGRIVFFNQPFDDTLPDTFKGYAATVWQRTLGAVEAAKRGAVGVLIRSVTSMPDDVPHTGSMRYKEGVPKIPAAALSVQAAERLSDLLDAGAVRVHMEMDCRTLDPVSSANVVGEIPGREQPGEIVLIGAHLDAWDVGQGAHDDGAGVSHVLEAARLIMKSGPPPRRTVRVVLFMNEENGLAGGRAYASWYRETLDQHVLALESDRGGFAPRGFGVTPSEGYIQALKPVEAVLVKHQLGRVVAGGGGADISPLKAAGVPVMELKVQSDRYFDFHHSAKDVLEAVHPRELARGSAAVAVMAYAVAEMEAPLRRAAAEAGTK